MARARLVLTLFGGLLLTASHASAEPSLWERARHPGSRAEQRLLVGVERMLDARDEAGDDEELAQRFARAAVALVDLAKLPAPRDPRLACAIADALLGADVGRTDQAERLLRDAIPKLPPGSLLAEAWLRLETIRSLRGDHAGARDADTRALDIAWEPDQRATAFYNRAESEVRLGELDRAVRDYEQSVTTARDPRIEALARFGLGVALERRGDLPAAYTALDLGLAIRLPLSRYASDDPLDVPGVFFSPPYERFYLSALLGMARARHADDAAERRADYEQALAQWDAYLLAAARDEPWLENARRHRARCAEELRKLPARRGRSGSVR